VSEDARLEFNRQENARQNEAILRAKEKFCPNCSSPSPFGGYCAVCTSNAKMTEQQPAGEHLACCLRCGMPSGSGCGCSAFSDGEGAADGRPKVDWMTAEQADARDTDGDPPVYLVQTYDPAGSVPLDSSHEHPPAALESEAQLGAETSPEDFRLIDRLEHLAAVEPAWAKELEAFFVADPFPTRARIDKQIEEMLQRYGDRIVRVPDPEPAESPRAAEGDAPGHERGLTRPQYCINCNNEIKVAGLCPSCAVALQERDIWSELRDEHGLDLAETGVLPENMEAAIDAAVAAGLIGERGAPGTVALAVQMHNHARTVRHAYEVSGWDVQSAHLGPTSFLRHVDGYSRAKADTVLLGRQTHAALDSWWKDWAIEQRQHGRDRVTVAELHHKMLESIEQTSIPDVTKQAMAWRLNIELYGDLGLRPEEEIQLPYANVPTKDSYAPSGTSPGRSGPLREQSG
jgi:hypothetical protein